MSTAEIKRRIAASMANKTYSQGEFIGEGTARFAIRPAGLGQTVRPPSPTPGRAVRGLAATTVGTLFKNESPDQLE
jgi:hypothetical protein